MREDCSSLRKRVTSATLSRVIPQSTGRRGRHSFRVLTTLDNPYRYVGQLGYYTHWMDPSLSDLLHLGVRFYEPGVGRFGQVDPLRRDYVGYIYSADIPTLGVDPEGLLWCEKTNRFPWIRCHWGDRPKPETAEEKAIKALAKWFMKEFSKACANCKDADLALDISLANNVVSMFANLPDKYKNALQVCMNAAKAMIEFPENAGAECMLCHNAISEVVGKSNYLVTLINCKCFIK